MLYGIDKVVNINNTLEIIRTVSEGCCSTEQTIEY